MKPLHLELDLITEHLTQPMEVEINQEEEKHKTTDNNFIEIAYIAMVIMRVEFANNMIHHKREEIDW